MLWKLKLDFIGMIDIQVREPSVIDLMKDTDNIGLHVDSYKQTYFKHGTMNDRTKLCSLIPVLSVTQGHSY